MANPENLKPGAHKLTREDSSKGGKKSAENRAKKKALRECIEALLEGEMTDRRGKTMTGAEALSAKLFKKAMDGDVRAFEVLRDTAGQKPVEKVVTAAVEPAVIEEIESMVYGNDEK